MALDLGAVVGRVVLEDVEFQRTYVRVVRQMSSLGAEASKSASGAARLDESLAALSSSAGKASVGLGRAEKSAAAQAAAEQKAAAVSQRHAAALAEVASISARYATESTKVQQAALREAAAQQRLAGAQAEAGSAAARQAAETARLASAEAAATGAADRLAAAQRTAAASSATVVAGTRASQSAFAGLLKTGAQLGLIIGGIELVKKGAEFVMAGRDLTTALNSVQAAAHATDAEMGPVRSQVIGLGHDLTVPRATAVDAATAIDDLVRAGMTLPRAMAAARSALLLMSVTQTDSAMSARVLGDALDEFRLPASEAAHVASMLGGAATATAGGLESIFDAMKFAGSRARAAKIPMSDLLASIVDLSKAGIQGSIAGTGLAMVIAKLASASPVTVKALEDLGINAWDAQGRFKGLPFVIQAVTDSAKRFGPNSKQFLGDLQAAFGARAGNIMAAFAGKGVEGLDRFQKRIDTFDLQGAANKMNRGFGAAMAQITKQLTALGIDFYQKVEPALASAAMWLGTSVPHAVQVLAQILGPTVRVIGGVFVAAWHAAVAVLGPVASMLGSIGHVLADNSTAVRDAATLVIGLWAAFKGYRIAVAAIAAVNTAILAFQGRVVVGNAAAAAFGTNLRGFIGAGGLAATAFVAVGAAIAAAGFKINSWIESGRSGVAVIEGLGGAVKSWQAALEAANGALDLNVLKSVAAQLQANGLAEKAAAAGISLNELTYGVTHGKDAFDQLVASWRAGGKPSDDTINAAGLLSVAFGNVQGKALDLSTVNGKLGTSNQISATAMEHNAAAAAAQAGAHKQLADSTHLIVDTSGNLVETTGKVADAADKATAALNAQTTASRNLKLAEDLLNNVNQSAETSTNAFQIALGNLRNGTALATNKNGDLIHSLKQTTVAGATNRQMLVGVIDAAKAQAQAVADLAYKHSHNLSSALRAGNSQLAKNEGAIRSAAAAAGLDKEQVDHLINSLGIVSKVHAKPTVDANTQPAEKKTASVKGSLAALNKQVFTPTVDANTAPANSKTASVKGSLAALNGQVYSPTVSVRDNASGTVNSIRGSLAALNGQVATTYVNVVNRVLGPPIPHAGGTGPSGLPRGWSTVGEQGWEGAYTDDSGRTHIVPHAAAMKALNLPDRIPGYAGGSVPGFADGTGPDFTRAIAMLRQVLEAALHRDPTTVSGAMGSFAYHRYAAVKDRAQSIAAYDAYKRAAEGAAKAAAAVKNLTKASDAQKNAAQAAADAAAKGAETAKTTWQNLKSVADAAGQAAADAASKLVDLTNAKVAAFADTVSGFRSGVAGGISGGVSLTSLYSDVGGDATAMAARAQKLLASAKAFNNDLHTLAKLGVSPSELAQVAALGAESGDAFAKQLIALGPTRIKALNASLDAINNTANAGAASLAQGFYGAGASALNSLVKGMQAHYPALKTALQPLVTQIAAMFHFTPIVTAPHYGGTSALPHHAAGGVNIGGWGMFGEHGPEIAWTPPHTSVWRHGITPRGYDDDRILVELRAVRERLESIERTVPANLAQTGAGLYERAGTKVASEMQRRIRAGRAQ